ncbi:MAG: glycosyltransferase [Anaerolineae bacterium]|nr:glycosyltransferase [Anaerolineae bacterium]
MEPIKQPHLIWINPSSLTDQLDAATWLQTTAELRRLGWCVTLVIYGDADCRSIGGVDVHCIRTPQIYLLRQVIFHIQCIFLILRQWRICDVILFYAMSAPWVLPLIFLRYLVRHRRPLFAMETRSLHMEPPGKETFKDTLRRWYHIVMSIMVIRWSDGNLVITRRMADSLGIPEDKLWGAWPSGVDADLFGGVWETRRWPEPEEPIRLIYVGSLNYERNLMTLSKAVTTANDEGMKIRLTMIGSGTEESDLKTFAETTSGVVEVKPSVPHLMVPRVLSGAHVGVLPFPDEEKFQVSSPIKLFEYMAAGLPILATRIACHTDVMDGEDFVFWADGSDTDALLSALRNLWHDRHALKEKGRQSMRAAHAWTWVEAARKLKSALEIGMSRYPLGSRRDGGTE